MVWIPIVIVLSVIGLGLIVFLILRSNQSQLQNGFRLLQDTSESLQRNLILLQKEFEKSFDTKSYSLKTELTNELQNNRRELQQGLLQTTQSLEQKFFGIDTKVDMRLKELTQSVQEKLELNLKEGFRHFEKVELHLKNAETQLQNVSHVGKSINDLNNLLKLPHLRGSFGEATLERLLSDLLPRGSYEMQFTIVPNSTERVDAIIRYPRCVLPIDSKFPRERVLPLFESSDPETLKMARKELADTVKGLARQIKEKYIHPEHGTTEMALLFIPSETLYFEILRDLKLCEDLSRLKVFPASPNTIAVMLHAISMAQEFYDMSKGVESTISELKKAQKHFENFEQRFGDLGRSLGKAQDAFDTASTHLGRYQSAASRLVGSEETPVEEIGTPHHESPPRISQFSEQTS